MPERCNSLTDNALHCCFYYLYRGALGVCVAFICVYLRLFAFKNGQKMGKNTTRLKNSCKFAHGKTYCKTHGKYTNKT